MSAILYFRLQRHTNAPLPAGTSRARICWHCTPRTPVHLAFALACYTLPQKVLSFLHSGFRDWKESSIVFKQAKYEVDYDFSFPKPTFRVGLCLLENSALSFLFCFLILPFGFESLFNIIPGPVILTTHTLCLCSTSQYQQISLPGHHAPEAP